MRHKNRIIFLFVLVFLAVGSNAIAKGTMTKTELDNGLTIILDENHASHVVAFQMWVNVGAADESDIEAGSAHLLEHMLFKGTSKRAVGEVASEVEAAGGNINAYTSHDTTVFHLVVPSRYFNIGIDIISDAIQHSSLDSNELEKEKQVVLEEIRMGEDEPGRRLYKDLLKESFSSHPYGRPVIGSRESVMGITRHALFSFYKKWYVPSNMTLVVVGDFETENALKSIRSYFANQTYIAAPSVKRSPEPPQTGLRISSASMDINESKLGISFHIPPLGDPETYTMDILSSILGDGRTSRLYKNLRDREHIVNSIAAYAMTPRDPGSFIVTAGLESGKIGAALSKIIKVLEQIAQYGITPTELERAKLQLESDFTYERETMEGTARQLGYFDMVAGGLDFEKKYLTGINAVTNADIKKAVQEYFTPENMTISLITPLKESNSIGRSDLVTIVNEAEAEAMAAERHLNIRLEPVKLRLDNGATLIIKEDHTNPTVAVYIGFPGGLRFEETKSNGMGIFIARMLTRGSARWPSSSFSEEIEGMASDISGFSGRNTFGESGKFLSRYFNKGLEMMADSILHPSFPDGEIEKVRKDILAAIKREDDYLPGLTFRTLYAALYKHHPYGLPLLGTRETVSGFSRKDLVNHYRHIVQPGRMVIAIVGDVNRKDATDKVRHLFNNFSDSDLLLTAPEHEVKRKDIEKTGAIKQSAQAHIGIGFLGATIKDDDRYALDVLSEILSGQGGRLFLELRDKQGLAYAVSAFSRVGVEEGIFAVYMGTAVKKQKEAVEGLLKQLEIISSTRVSDSELNRAKGALIGNYEIGLQESTSQASDMATNELLGIGYDEFNKYSSQIEAVTIDDVLRVADKYIDLKSYVLSIVGPGTP